MTKIYLNTLTPEEIIKRLKSGEVVRIDDVDGITFKMIDGIICRCYINKPYLIGVSLDAEDDDNYFEDAEPFSIAKNGKYRTRDGRIAYVAGYKAEDKDDFNYFGMIEDDDLVRYWNKSGENIGSSDRDLVEYIGD